MKTFQLHGAKVNYREDKITHIHYGSGIMSLEHATELIEKIKNESPWKISPIYASAEPFASHDSEARNYLVSKDVLEYCSAIGVFASSFAQKLTVNIFIKIWKPSKPIKLFSTETETLNWLGKFETKNKLISPSTRALSNSREQT